MRIVGKVVAWALGGLLTLMVVLAIYAAWQRSNDADYHQELPKTLVVESATFPMGADIPIRCTCEGGETQPAISWRGLPEGTQSVAIIAMDYDAPAPYLKLFAFNHYVTYNIPPSVLKLPEGCTKDTLQAIGASYGSNSMGDAGFVPPCPPMGKHAYPIRVYALDGRLPLEPGAGVAEVKTAMHGHVLAYGELVGYYAK